MYKQSFPVKINGNVQLNNTYQWVTVTYILIISKTDIHSSSKTALEKNKAISLQMINTDVCRVNAICDKPFSNSYVCEDTANK